LKHKVLPDEGIPPTHRKGTPGRKLTI